MLGAAFFGKFMQYRYFVFYNVRGNFLYNLYFVSVKTHICPRPMERILCYLLDNSLDQGRNQDFAKGGAELYTFQSKNSIAYWCICIIKRGTV